MMGTGEIINEKVYASPRPPPKIPFKDNWMKELGSEVAGGSEEWGTIWFSYWGNRKSFLFGCESTNVSTGRPVESCVSVSVERLDKDKDADENVDADQISTVRPVKSGQSTGLFTQREEIDIDFRVSGLPHAVVKRTENFRVRELVKKI